MVKGNEPSFFPAFIPLFFSFLKEFFCVGVEAMLQRMSMINEQIENQGLFLL